MASPRTVSSAAARPRAVRAGRPSSAARRPPPGRTHAPRRGRASEWSPGVVDEPRKALHQDAQRAGELDRVGSRVDREEQLRRHPHGHGVEQAPQVDVAARPGFDSLCGDRAGGVRKGRHPPAVERGLHEQPARPVLVALQRVQRRADVPSRALLPSSLRVGGRVARQHLPDRSGGGRRGNEHREPRAGSACRRGRRSPRRSRPGRGRTRGRPQGEASHDSPRRRAVDWPRDRPRPLRPEPDRVAPPRQRAHRRGEPPLRRRARRAFAATDRRHRPRARRPGWGGRDRRRPRLAGDRLSTRGPCGRANAATRTPPQRPARWRTARSATTTAPSASAGRRWLRADGTATYPARDGRGRSRPRDHARHPRLRPPPERAGPPADRARRSAASFRPSIHHGLLLGEDGKKLSKREGHSSVAELREDGIPAAALRAYLDELGMPAHDVQPRPAADRAAGGRGDRGRCPTTSSRAAVGARVDVVPALRGARTLRRGARVRAARPLTRAGDRCRPRPGPTIERFVELRSGAPRTARRRRREGDRARAEGCRRRPEDVAARISPVPSAAPSWRPCSPRSRATRRSGGWLRRRRRRSRLLVRRAGLQRLQRRARVDLLDRLLVLARATTQLAPDLRQLRRPEDQNDDDREDDQLPVTRERHGSIVARAPIRSPDAAPGHADRRARPASRSAHRDRDVRLRPDRLPARPHRERAAVRRVLLARPLASRARAHRDARPQHHRRQRQDLRRRARRLRRAWRARLRPGTSRTPVASV